MFKKVIFSILLSFAVLVSFVGCKKKSNENSPSINETSTTKEDFFDISDFYDTDDFEINKRYSESVIPGVRELSKYKTEYGTKRIENAVLSSNPKENSQKVTKSNKKDTKKDKKSHKKKNNENKPLQALGDTEKAELKSPDSKIQILQMYPCYRGKGEYEYSERRGALPPYDKTFFLRLNEMIKVEDFNKIVSAVVDTGLKLTLTPEPIFSDEYLFSWGGKKTIYKTNENKSNTFVVKITEDLPKDSTVYIYAGKGKEVTSDYFYTIQKFKFYSSEETTHYEQNQAFPLTIRFTQQVDINSLVENIEVNVDYTPTQDNFEINGDRVTIFNLPLEYEKEYKIKIKNGLKDVYGQTISFEDNAEHLITNENGEKYIEISFKTLKALSYASSLATGFNIMEAQFPHKFLLEYQNVDQRSFYWVENENLQLLNTKIAEYAPNDKMVYLDSQTRDKKLFEVIDLDPYLNSDGFGAVKISSSITYPYYDRWDKRYETEYNNKVTTIQVTDLAATVRFGLDKAVVLVSSLKTGKPIEGATVYLGYNMDGITVNEIKRNPYASGVTNKQGLAVINIPENKHFTIEANDNWYKKSAIVYVEKDTDSLFFYADNHYIRGYEINDSRPAYANAEKQLTFMFVDRGLYRPGEIVTFRGIDRNLQRGKLYTNNGDYTINIETWSHPIKRIHTMEGTLSESGGFYGSFKIPDDTAPGKYSLIYKRPNSPEYQEERIYFTVAEFERLKFETATTMPELTYYGGDSVSGTVKANYLAGGALFDATYDARWYKQPTTFAPKTPETKNYFFTNLNYSESSDMISQSNGKLDADGKIALNCKTTPITDGRPYQYVLQTDITDVANQKVRTQGTVTVHPAKFYVGIGKPTNVGGFAKKGEKLQFPYILVNPKGNQLSDTNGVKSLEYKLTIEEWKLAHEQSVSNSIYTRYKKVTTLEQEGTIPVKSKNTFEITPKSTGWYTLEVTGVDENDNNTIVKYSFYVTGGKSYWYNNNDDASINMTPNQNLYNPGETAQILLESSLPSGDYLITVEREGILSEEVKHFDSPANVIEIPIKADYIPVMYVAVSSYSVRTEEPKHEYGEIDLDKPKGYFGVTALHVNPSYKSFKVDINYDKPSYRPGEDVTVELTATRGGKPVPNAELTFMAVDRGVIDLINYHVPNPIEYFYREWNYPLCVVGGDSRFYLMDPVTYSIKDLIGGDADTDEEKEDERKDFNPTAVFEPVLITGQDGKVKCTFKMPDNLTTYRMTAFGVKDDLFALNEKEVKVQNPVNVQQVQPKKLRVRDTAECGVLITNLAAQTEAVTVTLEIRRPTKNTVQDEREGRITIPGNAFVDGPVTHTVNVESGYSSVVYFDVAATQSGTVELVYTVNSANLNEKLISPLNIEDTYVFETVALTGSTEDSQKEAFIIPGFTKNMTGELKFTLDATKLGPLSSAVDYVFDYPYGCLEQRASRILPLIIFEEYLDVFEMDTKVSDTKKCITSELKFWQKSQLSDGSFPYWPSGNETSIYVTARIAHICALAKARGYLDSEISLDTKKLFDYLSESGYTKSYEFQQAYITYVLSLAKHSSAKELATSLLKNMKNLNNVALSYLGLAFYEMGENKNAQKCANELKKSIKAELRSVTISPRKSDYIDLWYTSTVSECALALQLLVCVDSKDKLIEPLINTVFAQKSARGYWNNTSDTAKVLESVYTYIKQRNLDELNFTAALAIKDKKVMEESFVGVAAKPQTKKIAFTQEPLSTLAVDKTHEVEFSKNGEGTLYYTMEMKYALPDEILSSRNQGLEIEYTLTDVETGKKVNLENAVVELPVGRTYKAEVNLFSSGKRTYVAMRSPIPSGAEIIDSTFVTSATVENGDEVPYSYEHWLSNKYIRDNEVQFFWNNFDEGNATVTFTFRTNRRGVYPTPPVQAECMYEPEIFGRSAGNLFVIK